MPKLVIVRAEISWNVVNCLFFFLFDFEKNKETCLAFCYRWKRWSVCIIKYLKLCIIEYLKFCIIEYLKLYDLVTCICLMLSEDIHYYFYLTSYVVMFPTLPRKGKLWADHTFAFFFFLIFLFFNTKLLPQVSNLCRCICYLPLLKAVGPNGMLFDVAID